MRSLRLTLGEGWDEFETGARSTDALESLYMPQIEQFGVTLRRRGVALVGETSNELADAAVCVYAIPGVGVVTSHRITVRRDMPFHESSLPGLCVATLSADSLGLCPVTRPRGEAGAGVAVFGQDSFERSYPLRAGSEQNAVSMTLLPGWFERLDDDRRATAREIVGGVGETCPAEVAAVLDRLMRGVTPLFGGALVGERAVLRQAALATDVTLTWHVERERAEAAAGTLGQARLVRAARHHVAQHLGEDLTLDSLARDLLTSRSRLCAAFRAETGEGLGAYVRRARMERAAQLLEVASMGVAEVARSVGYPRVSRFVVAFEREFGVSPSSWRADAVRSR